MNPSCTAGCIEVEQIFQEAEQRDLYRDDTGDDPRMSKFPCFLSIKNGDYGHFNYAVMGYAVANHHNECLKILHRQTGARWHSSLACYAAEEDNLDALRYIVEHMDDIDTSFDVPTMSVRCQNYLKRLNYQ